MFVSCLVCQGEDGGSVSSERGGVQGPHAQEVNRRSARGADEAVAVYGTISHLSNREIHVSHMLYWSGRVDAGV